MQMGINLSRSTVRTFKHNDMDDLERVLQVGLVHREMPQMSCMPAYIPWHIV